MSDTDKDKIIAMLRAEVRALQEAAAMIVARKEDK